MATWTCPTSGVPMEEGGREKRRNLHRGAARGKALAMVITNTSDSLPSTTMPHTRSLDELVSIHIDRGAFQPIPWRASSHLQVGPRLRHASKPTLPIFSCIQDLPSTPHLPKAAGASFHPTSCASNRVHPSGAMQQLLSICRNETLHLLAIPPGSFFSSGDEEAPTRIGVRRHVPRTEAGARL